MIIIVIIEITTTTATATIIVIIINTNEIERTCRTGIQIGAKADAESDPVIENEVCSFTAQIPAQLKIK